MVDRPRRYFIAAGFGAHRWRLHDLAIYLLAVLGHTFSPRRNAAQTMQTELTEDNEGNKASLVLLRSSGHGLKNRVLQLRVCTTSCASFPLLPSVKRFGTHCSVA